MEQTTSSDLGKWTTHKNELETWTSENHFLKLKELNCRSSRFAQMNKTVFGSGSYHPQSKYRHRDIKIKQLVDTTRQQFIYFGIYLTNFNSCVNHTAIESNTNDPDWWQAANETGT